MAIRDFFTRKPEEPTLRNKITDTIRQYAPKEVVTAMDVYNSELGKKVRGFVASSARLPQRTVTSFGLEGVANAISAATGKNVAPVYTPSSQFEKFVFGEEPIRGIGRAVDEEFQRAQSAVGGDGLNTPIRTGANLAAVPFAMAAGITLDLTPFGGEAKVGKEAAEQLVKKYGDDVAKVIIRRGKSFVEKALKGKSDDIVRELGNTTQEALRLTPPLFPETIEESPLLRRSRTTQEIQLADRASTLSTKEDFGGVGSDRGNSYGEFITKNVENVNPPVGRGGIQPPKLDFTGWKDRSSLRLGRETMERNLEGVAGKEADSIKDFIVNPIRDNETRRISFLNGLRKEIQEKVVKNFGIRSGSKDDALIQRFGENLITLDELKQAAPTKWKAISESADFFRQKYDELLGMVNKEREKFGYTPIPKRPEYFRHFQEIDGAIQQFGLLFRQQDLPTEIAGITAIFNPGKPFSNAELRRFGTATTESAIKGMDNYLDSISKQIFHIDSVQRGRGLEKYIREAAKADKDIRLPNFVSNLHEYTNLVAGKKTALDRAFESVIGRKIYSVANAIRSRVSANMVGGNLSSALTNFVPFTQSLSTTSKPAAAKGVLEALSSPLKQTFQEIDGLTSSFLTRRFPVKNIDPRGLKKVSEVANWLFDTIDKFTAKSIVSGKFYEGVAKGMTKEKAMKAADSFAARVMADRSVGQIPNILNTQSLGAITQFQTEVNNAFSFMLSDIPKLSEGNKAKMINSFGQLLIFSYLANETYSKILGRRVAFDPLYYAMSVAGLTDETEGTPLKQRATDTAGEVVKSLPFVGTFSGGRLPISSGIPNIPAVVRGEASVSKEVLKPLTYVIPPFGGAQARKTIEGLRSYGKGLVETETGKPKYEIDQNAENLIRSAIFGKSGTKEAVEGNPEITRLIKLLDKQDSERASLRKQAEKLDIELSELPKEEAGKRYSEVKKENPALADALKNVVDERKLGLTLKERLMKQLGVANGARAKYIDEQIMALPAEERAAYYQELKDKKLISDEVAKQLKAIRGKN